MKESSQYKETMTLYKLCSFGRVTVKIDTPETPYRQPTRGVKNLLRFLLPLVKKINIHTQENC